MSTYRESCTGGVAQREGTSLSTRKLGFLVHCFLRHPHVPAAATHIRISVWMDPVYRMDRNGYKVEHLQGRSLCPYAICQI